MSTAKSITFGIVSACLYSRPSLNWASLNQIWGKLAPFLLTELPSINQIYICFLWQTWNLTKHASDIMHIPPQVNQTLVWTRTGSIITAHNSLLSVCLAVASNDRLSKSAVSSWTLTILETDFLLNHQLIQFIEDLLYSTFLFPSHGLNHNIQLKMN